MRHFALRHAPKNDTDHTALAASIRKIDPTANANYNEFLSNITTGKNLKTVPNSKSASSNPSGSNTNASSSGSAQTPTVKTEDYPYEYYYPSYQ